MCLVSSISRPVLLIGGRLVGRFLRLVPRHKLLTSVASYSTQCLFLTKQIQHSFMQPAAEVQVENTSLQSHRLEYSGRNTLSPNYHPGGSLDKQSSRRESCSRVLHLLLLSRPLDCSFGGGRRSISCPLAHPAALASGHSRDPKLGGGSRKVSFRFPQ